MRNCWQACIGADLILLSNTELFIGQAVAEKLRLQTCWGSLQPLTPSRYLANFFFPDSPQWLPGGGLYNYLTHTVVGEVLWQWLRLAVNAARKKVLGLAPVRPLGPYMDYLFPPVSLDGYSPVVVPPAPDRASATMLQATGSSTTAQRYRPPADLAAFLAAGPAPIYVGFGSMHNRDAEGVTHWSSTP